MIFLKGEASLYLVSVTFAVFKALEYSLRGALTEMVRRSHVTFVVLVETILFTHAAPLIATGVRILGLREPVSGQGNCEFGCQSDG